jgi:dihydroorotase
VPSLYEAGVRVFTDDGDSVRDSELMREVMELVAQHPGALVAQHAEDPAATAGSHLHEGEVARRLGLRGMPAEAETSVVNRDLQLAAATGVRYHCQHVSSRHTLDALGEARRQGARVTSEVTPHHLILDETDLGDLDTNRKMYPPLRSRADRLALVKALRRGMIDVVATDHAPHTSEEKHVPFAEAPRGVIGLETAAAAVWEVLGDADRLFEVLSSTPARLIGLSGQGQPVQTGASANIVVFDPRAGWTVETFASKSANSPFLGREMIGRVRSTIHDGEVVHTRDTRW